MRNGFTLAEFLIAMTIAAVIITVTIPVITGGAPSATKIMMRKSYTVAERIVSKLINDPAIYPDRTSEGFLGFDDTNKDFGTEFISKLNLSTEDGDEIMSVDGIAWDLSQATGWNKGSADKKPIIIDVNGEKKPNCRYNASTCKKPDIYWIYVQTNGRLEINSDEDPTAAEAITGQTQLRD